MAEVYAGFLSHCDDQIGRLLAYLEDVGQLDNTVFVVVSDNGASGEGGPNGSVNENKFFNNVADDLAENLAMIDKLGGVETYGHYLNGWAMAFDTPFKMWKRYSFNGGTRDPCIISWPAGIAARGEVRDQYHHAVDIVPTVLDCLGLDLPETVKGHRQTPLQGVSMRYSFDSAALPSARTTQFYSMLGTRGIWHQGWKAVTTHPAISGWSDFHKDTWELYHTDTDRAELVDLAQQEPARLQQLIGLWFYEAGVNHAFPLDDRSALEILSTPRPELTPARNRYVYRPGGSEVPESVAVNIRNRSYSVGALVDLPGPGASFLGSEEQRITATEDLPTGEKLILAASFDKDGEASPGVATGILSLYQGDRKVGEGRIRTQPGRFTLAGEGLNAGKDNGDAGTADYPGTAPTRSPAARCTGSPSTSAATRTSTWNGKPRPCSPASSRRRSGPVGRRRLRALRRAQCSQSENSRS
ncbi:sulfatase-like hydrolase/transferase [Streptomyces sp. NPDC058583]|uniref:sulfatase-like hydrolase/transferase n=1 Tax=unclassified Streptomyces TaxID=2593676 RepID=UPI0036674E24